MHRILAVILFALAIPAVAFAETFTMGPDDDWTILEAAQAGDVVEIAPGTYRFRVHLDNVGTPDAPIVIRAQDPNERPVWDLVGDGPDTFVDQWPGSYGGGDRHRGCWQVAADGAYYEISGIIFQNCRARSSAGLRMINSGPVTIRDSVFRQNTNGLTGASTDLVVEHCEFVDNGKTITSGNATHHIYVFGGKFTLRYSYLHDGHEGQAFHIRARESLIEYNWIARPASYVGDIMSCSQFCGDPPHTQTMLLRGNVIVQGEAGNQSQLLALFRDENPDTSATMDLTLAYNTIIGTPRGSGRDHFLVNMRNDTVSAYVHLFNNVIHDVGDIGQAHTPGAANWGIDGSNNWVRTGTAASELSATLEGTDPGFANPAALDFTLLSDAAAVGHAEAGAVEAPDREYFRSEDDAMRWRSRPSPDDLGAFEQGNAEDPVGPHRPGSEPGGEDVGVEPNPGVDTGVDPDPAIDATPSSDTDEEVDDPTDSAPGARGGGSRSADAEVGPIAFPDDGGCGCTVAGSHPAGLAIIVALVLAPWRRTASHRVQTIAASL